MGKIRVKALEGEELEDKQKEKGKEKKEQKQARKMARLDPARLAKGAHGGERVVAIGPSEEELTQIDVPKETKEPEVSKEKTKSKKIHIRARSKKYQAVAQLVEKNKLYPLPEALSLLPKLKTARFDETVELHINTTEKLTGQATLPHGTGKKTRVAIADDNLIDEVEKGKVNFDVLLSTPEMMSKLAKVAKFLGPRGLMPSPKNGTITNKPEEAAKKYEGGQINFKTEAKTPIIHLAVGKLSFGEKKLLENIQTILAALPKDNIKNATLKSTMSPGIKIDLTSVQ
ncbi:MAG: 50S ribosomal protein L1 [bacterium]|nr:50S ribosomal protein L1 [bacterium]